MPLSTYITQENVRFDGILTNAVVLDKTANVRTLIQTDGLSTYDKEVLAKFLDSHLSGTPGQLAAPTKGFSELDFGSTTVGATATGLSNAVATAGSLAVNFKSPVTETTPTGYRAETGTSGYQVANFTPTLTGSSPTGLTGSTAATAGYVELPKAGVSGTTPTGLSNTATAAATAGRQDITKAGLTGAGSTGLDPATTYTATVTINGAAKAVSVLGSDAQTFTTLATAITTSLAASGTAAVSGAAIRVTSATTGVASTVAIVDGTLIAAIGGAIAAAVPGTAATTATTYTTTITVDGTAVPVSFLGTAAQTYAALVTQLNTALGAAGTSAIVGAAVRITSATTGVTSTVAIGGGNLLAALAVTPSAPVAGKAATSTAVYTADVTVAGKKKLISVDGSAAQTMATLITELNADLGADAVAAIVDGDIRITAAQADVFGTVLINPGTLFPALTGFASILNAVGGAGQNRTYSSIFYVDGVEKRVEFLGSQAATLADVVTQINADLGASATASIANNQLVITSATTGSKSSVTVWDGGYALAALAGYNGITYATGKPAATYQGVIVVDGVPKNIDVAGTAVQTFTQLVAVITTAVGASADVTFTGGKIKILSKTTGVNSTVSVNDGTLFHNLAHRQGGTQYRGIANLLAAFDAARNVNTLFTEIYRKDKVGETPALPAAIPKANLQKAPPYVYYGGTPLAWRFMADDTEIG